MTDNDRVIVERLLTHIAEGTLRAAVAALRADVAEFTVDSADDIAYVDGFTDAIEILSNLTVQDVKEKPMTKPTDPADPTEPGVIQATVVVTDEPIGDPSPGMGDRLKAANEAIEADRRARIKLKAEIEADRSLAYILLSTAVQRAQHYADELQITRVAWFKISTMTPGPERDANLAFLAARKEVAEANLPDALNLQAARLKLLAAVEAGECADQPTANELWTRAVVLGGMPSMAYLWTKYVGVPDAAAEAPAPVEPTP